MIRLLVLTGILVSSFAAASGKEVRPCFMAAFWGYGGQGMNAFNANRDFKKSAESFGTLQGCTVVTLGRSQAEQGTALRKLAEWRQNPANRNGKVISLGYSRGGAAAVDWARNARADLQFTIDPVTWFGLKDPAFKGNGRENMNVYQQGKRSFKSWKAIQKTFIRGSRVENATNEKWSGVSRHTTILNMGFYDLEKRVEALTGRNTFTTIDAMMRKMERRKPCSSN